MIGGFRLRWHLEGIDPKKVDQLEQSRGQSCSKSSWKYQKRGFIHKNENMLAVVSLAREILKRNTSEDVAWSVLLKHRWSEDVKDPCLNETQIGEIIQRVKSELDLSYSLQSCTEGDELALGLEFYIALNSCQDQTVEANQLFVFFKSLLLSNHSDNLLVLFVRS